MIIVIGLNSGIASNALNGLLSIDHVIGTVTNSSIFETRTIIQTEHGLQVLEFDLRYPENFLTLLPRNLDRITLVFAGTFSKDELILNSSAETALQAFQVNVLGPLEIIKQLLPKMISKNFGRVIFLSSHVASQGKPGTHLYASTKSTLRGLSATISREYGRFGVTSNIIELGYFNAGLIKGLSEKELARITKSIPSQNLGTSDSVVNTIRFVISEGYLNGAVIKLDGGYNGN
jgi:3-oxoacyl-[acyl-carrier protein] reductase